MAATSKESLLAPVLRNRLPETAPCKPKNEEEPNLSSKKAHFSRSRSMSVSGERLKDGFGEKLSSPRWSRLTRSIFLLFTFVAAALRLYKIAEPAQVVFDEVHFGGFASHYLKGTYFFDVHPPLGKMIIAAIGHVYGYKGTFGFKDIGDNYSDDPTVPFAQMRTILAGFSIGAVMFAMATLVEMGFSPYALTLSGILLALDNGLVTQSRFIFLDGIMLFFIFGSVFCWTKFRRFRYKPFSVSWWASLALTGLFISGTISVKMVGLFTVALVGIACFYDLWELADWKRQMNDKALIKHFFARFSLLAIVPIIIYLSLYYLHFALLPLSGPGDAHMSIPFQKTLKGSVILSDMRPVYYGQSFRIENIGEKIFLHSHRERIPLNHEDGKISSQGQQVNGYAVLDENNIWEFKRIQAIKVDNPENQIDFTKPTEKIDSGLISSNNDNTSKPEREPIRLGDTVQVCHKSTGKCLLAHDVASPLTKTNMEITMYESGGIDNLEFTHWIIESDEKVNGKGKIGEAMTALGSSFRLLNKQFNVRLLNYGKNLPAWGFGQREINGCRITGVDLDYKYSWMISNVEDPMTEEEEAVKQEALKTTKPMNFFKKFWELQVYSIVANAGLVDEHPYKSRPQEWILPRKGLGFWNDTSKARIFLLGNFVAWTLAIFGVFVFIVRFSKDKFIEHRGSVMKYYQDHFFKRFGHKVVYLFGGYLLHYLPFYLMQRSLYLHHYLPSYIFSVLLTSAQFDCMTRQKSSTIKIVLLSIIGIATLGAFIYFIPLVYGTEIESELLNKRKFIKSWNF